jgi:hypothetical protein
MFGLTSAPTSTSTPLPTHFADSGGDMFKALLAVSQREMTPGDGAAAALHPASRATGLVHAARAAPAASNKGGGGKIEIGLRPLEDTSQSRCTFREISVAGGNLRITFSMTVKLLLRTRRPKWWSLPLQGIYLRLVQVFPRGRPNELHTFRTGASKAVVDEMCFHHFFSIFFLFPLLDRFQFAPHGLSCALYPYRRICSWRHCARRGAAEHEHLGLPSWIHSATGTTGSDN